MPAALTLTDRIRSEIEASVFAFGQSQPGGTVTASLGVATLAFGESPKGLVERADKALYASKAAGRNQVSFAPPPGEQKCL